MLRGVPLPPEPGAGPGPEPSHHGPDSIPPQISSEELAADDDSTEVVLDEQPSLIVYPLGIVLWAVGATLILGSVPPAARPQAFGIVLFLLPLAMAVLAAFLNVFTRSGFPRPLRTAARTLVFACLWPFVAWGQWDAKRRKR